MTDELAEPPKPKSSKLPLLIGLVLAILGGGGGFVFMNKTPAADDAPVVASPAEEKMADPATSATEFVALDPLLITPPAIGGKILRFTAQLEVTPASRAEVEQLKPRIVDVFNTYLRAIEPADFEKPEVLVLLRAHLLRRISLVVGENKVTDVLIMEFVLN